MKCRAISKASAMTRRCPGTLSRIKHDDNSIKYDWRGWDSLSPLWLYFWVSLWSLHVCICCQYVCAYVYSYSYLSEFIVPAFMHMLSVWMYVYIITYFLSEFMVPTFMHLCLFLCQYVRMYTAIPLVFLSDLYGLCIHVYVCLSVCLTYVYSYTYFWVIFRNFAFMYMSVGLFVCWYACVHISILIFE
jgi:hypothetical protein